MRTVLLLCSAAALAVACSDAAEPDTEGGSDKIIGGTPAKGSQLDAVGALRRASGADAGVVDAGAVPTGFKSLCTATLIAPRLIVTAKHCAANASDTTVAISDTQTLFFTIGPDANKPKRAVRVVRSWLSPIVEDGYVGYGSDVAVMQLEESIDDVTPLKVADAHLDAALERSRFSAVGFGYRDRAGRMGARRAGTLTLQATKGPFMASVFPTRDAMIAFARTESPQGFSPDDEDRLTGLWDRKLLTNYEAFVGLAYGDSQPCSGDSGSPLLARVGNELVVAGVVSGSHKLSNRSANPCSVLGQIYATFGVYVQSTFTAAAAAVGQPIVRTSLRTLAPGSSAALPSEPDASTGDAGSLSDRCQGLSKEGTCVDGTVQRCIADTEGPPRPVRIDCTLLLSACAVNATTRVAECVNAP